jgi:hypothetical protein
MQHRTLVDRTLVCDLSRIERWRDREKCHPGNAAGTAGALAGEPPSTNRNSRRTCGSACNASGGVPASRCVASGRHASMPGGTSAASASRSGPAITPAGKVMPWQPATECNITVLHCRFLVSNICSYPKGGEQWACCGPLPR